MSCPLIQNGSDPFENVYTASQADSQELGQLKTERQHRHVPKAAALVIEVQARVCAEASLASPLIKIPSTALTVAAADEPAVVFNYPLASISISTSASLPAPAEIQTEPSWKPLMLLTPPAQEPLPIPMSVDDACQLLKVTLGSTWELIEQARRSLVLSAHPSNVATLSPNKRMKAFTDAARVNAAYLKLFTLRQGL